MTSQHGTSPRPAAPSRPAPSHLRWPGLAALPPDVQAALAGPGAPFEVVTEAVLGHDHQVFARRPRTLRQMLDGQAASTPDLPFLIAPDHKWTYREALADIDKVAALLGERYGVGVGDRVAVVAANHAEYAILMWATITLGAIVTSLNGWWTAPELAYGISLTTPRLVAGDERRLARLADGIVPGGVPVRLLGELAREAREWRPAERCSPEPSGHPDITEDSPAVILFTSGTTGRPKGATLSHRNIINFAMVNRLAAAAGAVATASAPVARAGAPAHGCTIVSSPMFHV
jgi:acyl-CoA synthetase (AMP-forming)/AMP-acid ligase II